jgi:hypothetical protein
MEGKPLPCVNQRLENQWETQEGRNNLGIIRDYPRDPRPWIRLVPSRASFRMQGTAKQYAHPRGFRRTASGGIT